MNGLHAVSTVPENQMNRPTAEMAKNTIRAKIKAIHSSLDFILLVSVVNEPSASERK